MLLFLLPILIGGLEARQANPKWKKVKMLVDSSSSAWNTMWDQFKTVDYCKIQLCLPELNSMALINVELHIINRESKYDVILGRVGNMVYYNLEIAKYIILF